MISKPSTRGFHERLVAHERANACSTSCPDCLRSYSNPAYHNLLDWRLVVDISELALDSGTEVSLAFNLWRSIAETAARTLLSARPSYAQISLAGLLALTNGTKAGIATHPLWRADHTTCIPNSQRRGTKLNKNMGWILSHRRALFPYLKLCGGRREVRP